VQGNRIGTDATGSRTLLAGTSNVGILFSNTGGNNQVGGTTAGAGNVVAGLEVGVYIFATQSQFNPTAGSLVAGNRIGTDVSGQKALGNNVGLYINGVPNNVVGGSTPGARNLISANQVGIYLLGTTATGNQIRGNYIGLRGDGKTALGNHIGIYADGASSNTITGNLIAGNLVVGGEGSTGIYLFNGTSNTTITANSIGTNASGQSNRTLAQGDYGVLLYNASNNAIAKSRGSNRIVGSGIANVREFTSAAAARQTTTTSGAVKTRSTHPAGPARIRASR
jgi:parallel beta-helix repeat protein